VDNLLWVDSLLEITLISYSMMIPNKVFILSAVLLLAGCATTATESGKAETTKSTRYLDSYPTRDRVDYVLTCIAQHGGLSYVTQYACGCKIDKIAEFMPFEEYDSAKTFGNLRGIPGESGAVFRGSKQAKDLKSKLKEAEAAAEKTCFVK
jgi:hypothetical protein